ncbi:MAG: hypothetical protein JST31_12975 [Actinobacteria bacterium]|nr:hypothetical protein [Actinomycetota bacterium]
MRLALPLVLVALLAGLLAGCGGGSSTTTGGSSTAAGEAPAGASPSSCGEGSLQVTGVSCAEAKAVLAGWQAAPGCRIEGGASHASCRVHGYLCIAAAQGERAAVSCALPGKSILFVPKKG